MAICISNAVQTFIQGFLFASFPLLFVCFGFFYFSRRASFADIQISTWTTHLSDSLGKNQFCLFVGQRGDLILSGATATVQKVKLICLSEIRLFSSYFLPKSVANLSAKPAINPCENMHEDILEKWQHFLILLKGRLRVQSRFKG